MHCQSPRNTIQTTPPSSQTTHSQPPPHSPAHRQRTMSIVQRRPLHNALQFLGHQRLQLLLAHPSFVTRQTHKHNRSTAHKEIRHLSTHTQHTQTNERINEHKHKHTKMTDTNTQDTKMPAAVTFCRDELCPICAPRPFPNPCTTCTHCAQLARGTPTPTEALAKATAERPSGRVDGVWLPCATPGCGSHAGLFRVRDVLKACVRAPRRCGADRHYFRRRDALRALRVNWYGLVRQCEDPSKEAWVARFRPAFVWLDTDGDWELDEE
jgi:hypothetical protein